MTTPASGSSCPAARACTPSPSAITGAELWQSASDWGFTSLLSDPRRMGDYQGVWGLGYQVSGVLFPGLFTFLALTWGTPGWLVIAALGVGAALASRPLAARAERHLAAIGAAG